jgi:hypothetical protein
VLSETISRIGDNLILIDVSRVRGVDAVCARVPKCPGVYAWFNRFAVPDPQTSSPEVFADFLCASAEKPHCQPRHGRLPPLYEVELRSRKTVNPAKRESLLQHCQSESYRRFFAQMLGLSLLFQQPLYIGKATNLATRIAEHLEVDSDLRTRLAQVEMSIDRTWLLLVLTPNLDDEPGAPTDMPRVSTLPVLHDPELVTEEVLSKLFHPLFTIRYG